MDDGNYGMRRTEGNGVALLSAPDGHRLARSRLILASSEAKLRTPDRRWQLPPHAIQINAQGIIYVANRENGRIEKFDLNGNFLGEISHLGRTYSIKLTNGALWASMGPFDRPPGGPGWVVKLDPRSGTILGHFDVPEERGGHCLELMASGEPLITLGNELLWFKER